MHGVLTVPLQLHLRRFTARKKFNVDSALIVRTRRYTFFFILYLWACLRLFSMEWRAYGALTTLLAICIFGRCGSAETMILWRDCNRNLDLFCSDSPALFRRPWKHRGIIPVHLFCRIRGLTDHFVFKWIIRHHNIVPNIFCYAILYKTFTTINHVNLTLV